LTLAREWWQKNHAPQAAPDGPTSMVTEFPPDELPDGL